MDSPSNPPEPLRYLADEYRALNSGHVEILAQPPSALEFSRLVHISRPVVIKGFEIPALNLWTDDYLIDKMGDRPISVAVTPDGRADAIHKGPDGLHYFVEPFTEKMTLKELFKRLDCEDDPPEIHYLQSQNGNLFSSDYFSGKGSSSEFVVLQPDVPSEISWCSEALDRQPEAVNLWIGSSKSITSIHSDPYENIYAVVRGAKRFTLISPTDGWCIREHYYPHAQFNRPSPDEPLEIKPSPPDAGPIRWTSLPDRQLHHSLPEEIQPVSLTLRPGEALYLPVGWWHQVEQSDETIALNWWYDTETRGLTWAVLSTLRTTQDVPNGNCITR